MSEQGMTDALIWGIAIGGVGLVCLCLIWALQKVPAIARWLAWLEKAKDIEEGRTTSEIKPMRRNNE